MGEQTLHCVVAIAGCDVADNAAAAAAAAVDTVVVVVVVVVDVAEI